MGIGILINSNNFFTTLAKCYYIFQEGKKGTMKEKEEKGRKNISWKVSLCLDFHD